MTTPYLDSYLIGSKGINNFGADSLAVLKALLEVESNETIEADREFIRRIIEFFANSDNIWAKRNGVYINNDPAIIEARNRRISEIAFIVGFDEARIDSLITRIYNAFKRHFYKGTCFNSALAYSEKRLKKVMEDIEAEA